MIEKAMIMAAGVGSRLEPMSSIVPKPLVPLANIPAMDILVGHLLSFNIKNIIANTYYRAEDIQNHYKNSNFDVNMQFIKEKELSGTAGGLRKCRFFFDEDKDFIVMSGDGLTDLNIEEAYLSHIRSKAIATIVMKEVEHQEVSKYGIIVPDDKGFVHSFQEKPSIEEAKSNLANTGIYIFNYKIFDFIPENTFYDFAKNVFPSVLKSGLKINTFKMNGYWSDIGSLSQYKRSNMDLIQNKIKTFALEVIKTMDAEYIEGSNFTKNIASRISGRCIIGNNCSVGRNSLIKNSILWDNVKVGDDVKIENSIILSDIIIEKSVYNEVVFKTQVEEKNKVFL